MFCINKLCTKAIIENIKSLKLCKRIFMKFYGLVAYWLILKLEIKEFIVKQKQKLN